MPQNFLPCDRDQVMLMPPDVREWLPQGHLAWLVIEAVEGLDLAEFYGAYRADGHGRAAHDPRMMTALLLYAYAIGERSSRKIERRTHEDVAFRVIAANTAPDHSTISRFRARHEEAFSALFTEVLRLCMQRGLLRAEALAIDSTKISADASGVANRTYEQIAADILREAADTDAAEDEVFGEAQGDELPAELIDPASRKELLAGLRRRLEAERGSKPVPAARADRLEEARERLEAEHTATLEIERGHERWREQREAELAAEGKKMRGRRPAPKELPETPAGRVNTTDPDSMPVKTPQGFIQGYSAHVAATVDQVILAAEVTTGSCDGGHLAPLAALAGEQALKAGGEHVPEYLLADAGYWSEHQVEDLAARGTEVLVPPDKLARSTKPLRSAAARAMKARLARPDRRAIYSSRSWMVEPVFGQIKSGRGTRRFSRRGLGACRSEWQLICAAHNLLKIAASAEGAPATA